jgi:hypothetical protein
LFPPFDASFDGLDSAADGFLDEVRSKACFVAEFVVESLSCSRISRDIFGVGVVGPAELSGTVGTVKELSSRFVEVVAALVGNDKFDGRGTSDLHISDVYPTILKYSGVRRS